MSSKEDRSKLGGFDDETYRLRVSLQRKTGDKNKRGSEQKSRSSVNPTSSWAFVRPCRITDVVLLSWPAPAGRAAGLLRALHFPSRPTEAKNPPLRPLAGDRDGPFHLSLLANQIPCNAVDEEV
ncbi:predicted protein [Uncinocarpus reesii 1704]|uniref:Uncharacterized protein n=1 Tax=Uncinocarpus reesii (strain UAMH 1704) TaxID=336963 RepID=C4JZZ6_UNCRE|nr:uncharacterized protein UREG_07747 [Uncinocarpus reesii 1704]EEP82882.1 predicted protein [Uncinocarpus reesii 1704]